MISQTPTGLCPGTWATLRNPEVIRHEWDRRIIVCPECGREVAWTETFGVAGHKAPAHE